MKVITAPLHEMGEYEKLRRVLQEKQVSIEISGCIDSQKLHMMYGLSGDFDCKIIVTFSDIKAKELYEEYRFYDKEVILYPAKDLIFYQADIHGNLLSKERIKGLRKILEGKAFTMITTFDTLMAPQLPLEVWKKHRIHLWQGSMIEEGAIAIRLVEMGYQKNYQVESPGQFSIRGGIIDIFDLTEENPYRIELWGDEIESIRSFDVLSQRSVETLEDVIIYPATEMILTDAIKREGFFRIQKDAEHTEEHLRKAFKTEEAHRISIQLQELKEQMMELGAMVNMESYIHYFYPETTTFPKLFSERRTIFFLDEPNRIKEHVDAVELEFRESMSHRLEKGYILPGQMDILRGAKETIAELLGYPVVAMSAMGSKGFPIKYQQHFDIMSKSVAPYNNSFEALLKDLRRFKKNGYRVLLLSASRTRAKRLAEDLLQNGLNAFYSEDVDRELKAGEIMTFYGQVKKGFEYPLLKFVVLSETDIFGSKDKGKKKKKRKYEGQKIRDFAELHVGDYVVHENHGLGIYQGIEKVEMEGVVKDYMKIAYRDGGNLYILATGLDVIQKYASSDAKKPKLNKLGTKEWLRTKSKVRGAVTEVARDLVELYAKRQETEGYAYGEDTVWQKEFEEMFPFDETEDQLLAIDATKADMESKRIMDRLVCGDVGFGKTEIAIRAAFKAVQEGKQVAYLVPTTILAQQHYTTFVQRMKEYPVTIELMSRFRTSAQQKETIKGLQKGMVDIVIGTHRLLSKDVGYKDLGLLIIDEEQRFGVTHKEKIKQLKENVDVLTLTATPIPRTLHMSLIGIRDMSVLEEAPGDRLPIQTYVMEYNEEMVREAIVRELSRGGQVYYVYNRVQSIDEQTAAIQALVPEASVAFAHGQMREQELEKIMYEFVNGEIDVLVSTTIIETGLDISNANTMIIHDSDNMGLAQLYQLRGRVGRSNKTSYAFLMYKRDKVLREVAEKRLTAIKEFTELGSGFKIAMRDLEIRGAGNLLGKQQHGNMEAVGYDLYCKMLHEAVKGIKGVETKSDFNTSVDLDVDAYIPAEYIVNEYQKLDIYKRIASLENPQECDEMRDELLDRFGSIPESVEHLLRISLIRVKAHNLYITELKGKIESIRATMEKSAPVYTDAIEPLLRKYQGTLKINTKGTPAFFLHYQKHGLQEKEAALMLEKVEELLQNMESLYV